MLENIDLYNDLPPAAQELIARLLLLLLVLVLIVVLRRVLTWIIVRPLKRLAKRTGFTHDDALLEAMMLPIRLVVIAVAIVLGLEVLGLGDDFDEFLVNISRTLIMLAILVGIYKLVDLLAASSFQLARITGIEMEERLLPFMRTAVKLVIIAMGIVIILQEWGYDVSGLIAGFGLGGLAFSLAAQDTVSNLFGFMAIVSDNPFDVGEYVITPDSQGIVEHVGLRTTRIRTLDQALIYVPNSTMANSAITNWSRLSKRRINYNLGVTYDTTSGDMRVLLDRIREMMRNEETIDSESVTVIFTEFGDSALNILVRAYVLIADWGEFHMYQEQIHMKIMDIVDDLNLSIAFPSMSLYVENLPPVEVPEEPPTPRLSPRERALKAGYIRQTDSEKPNVTDNPEENITGQQDEADT
jgi:MscS family membrane protein